MMNQRLKIDLMAVSDLLNKINSSGLESVTNNVGGFTIKISICKLKLENSSSQVLTLQSHLVLMKDRFKYRGETMPSHLILLSNLHSEPFYRDI